MNADNNALKILMIDCLIFAFSGLNISIQKPIKESTKTVLILTNKINNIQNILCIQHNNFLEISVVNNLNTAQFIDYDYSLELEISLILKENGDIQAEINGLYFNQTELFEAGFDAREIFDDIKRLQQKFSTEQE